MANPRGIRISKSNLIQCAVYFSVRKSINQTWINDRDPFLVPSRGWETDTEIQNDCLAFTLFTTHIQSGFGKNYWIPFTEQEVNAKEKFESNFMSKFIQGKLNGSSDNLFGSENERTDPLSFSNQATAVFNAGKELWTNYHQQPQINVNASLYDIRESFQKRNEKGKMNHKSADEEYMELITKLRYELSLITTKITPNIYKYKFLKH